MVRSPSGPEAAIEKMISEAEKTLGWSDDNNTKKTPVHTWYEGKFGNPDPGGKYAWDWCDAWMTYVAHHAGQAGPVLTGTGMSYTVSHANAFKARGTWHDGADGIQRGDVVFFDWADGNGIEHVGLVVGIMKATGEIATIEGNTLNTVARRVRATPTVAGYGRPKYGVVAAPIPPPPKEAPAMPTAYTPPAFPKGLRPNSSRPSARGLQAALKAAGYMSKTIAVADNYGPSTQAAVAQFHRQHPSVSDGSYDPEIGPTGWATLHREAYGGAKAPEKPSTAPPASTPVLSEPRHDYGRVSYGGKTVNVRTRTMLQAARGLMGLSGPFNLTQGSYNRGVGASAGTHDGGGVVDVNTNGLNVNATLRALRQAGFAAWYRTPAEGFDYHIHACAIGDREMASGARSQVSAYFRGRNGLANNGSDSAPASVGRPYPQWARKYA